MPTQRKDAPAPGRDVFAERHALGREALSPACRRVAAFIDAHRLEAIASSAAELGRATGTSDATVVRAVQALGFRGMADLRAELAACYGGTAPADNLARTWDDVGDSAEAAMDGVLDSLAAALDVLRAAPLRRTMTEAVKILHVARRIVVFGLGPTAHIAAYFAARLRRKGRRQAVLDRTGTGLADQLLDLEQGDVILMLAYGKPYREAEATVAEARRLRLPLVLVSDAPAERLSRHAAAVLAIPRGRSGHVALHGTTVACLEMVLLGLATTGRDASVSALEELARLRAGCA